MKYSERVLEELKKNNPYQPEFIQAATEVLESLSPVVDTDPRYEKAGLLERLVEPERTIMFRIPWVTTTARFMLTVDIVFSLIQLSVLTRAA